MCAKGEKKQLGKPVKPVILVEVRKDNGEKQLRTVPGGLMIAENQGKDGPEGLKDFHE